MELGQGLCLEARQKRILVDDNPPVGILMCTQAGKGLSSKTTVYYILAFLFDNQINAITQIIAESRLPSGAAQPIGNKVSGQYFDASQAPGILISKIEVTLCINERIDFPIAQK